MKRYVYMCSYNVNISCVEIKYIFTTFLNVSTYFFQILSAFFSTLLFTSGFIIGATRWFVACVLLNKRLLTLSIKLFNPYFNKRKYNR